MAQKAKRPCNSTGCRNFAVNKGYCQQHQSKVKVYNPVYEKQRGNSAQRGYGHKWRKESKQYLDDNPLCVTCQTNDLTTGAEVVDHIIPHRGDDKLFWRRSNWQALCKRCHDQKTARGE